MGKKQSRPLVEEDVDEEISIMILGKPGIGKSTLVNEILGDKVAKVSSEGYIATKGCTRAVEQFQFKRNGITGIVYDTPGILDPSLDGNVMEEIVKACTNVDIILFCIKMLDNRLVKGDENCLIIKHLEEKIGKEIWKKTIVALIRANELVQSFKDSDITPTRYDSKFCITCSKWYDIMKEKLISFQGIIAIGHPEDPKILLSDKYPWVTNIWGKCLISLPTDGKKAALIQLNRGRFKHNLDYDFKGNRDSKSIPIIITNSILSTFEKMDIEFRRRVPWFGRQDMNYNSI